MPNRLRPRLRNKQRAMPRCTTVRCQSTQHNQIYILQGTIRAQLVWSSSSSYHAVRRPRPSLPTGGTPLSPSLRGRSGFSGPSGRSAASLSTARQAYRLPASLEAHRGHSRKRLDLHPKTGQTSFTHIFVFIALRCVQAPAVHHRLAKHILPLSLSEIVWSRRPTEAGLCHVSGPSRA